MAWRLVSSDTDDVSGNVFLGDDELLSTDDAAAILGLAPGTLIRWRGAGIGPPWVRLGTKTVRYRRADVRAWIADQLDATEEGP